jgi:hypothetical protein
MDSMSNVPNGFIEPYPHVDFDAPCTSPCCEPEAYGEYPWSCEGDRCLNQLAHRGMCIPCAEKEGMLEENVLGTLNHLQWNKEKS